MVPVDDYSQRELPSLNVDVVEDGNKPKRGFDGCIVGKDITFKADSIASYFFVSWNRTVHDALLVAASAEFCDRNQRRPSNGWGREFNLRIPVHEPGLWSSKPVSDALHDALRFLTGDRWDITFYARKKHKEPPPQILMDLVH